MLLLESREDSGSEKELDEEYERLIHLVTGELADPAFEAFPSPHER
jgi:hypothetical protein